MSAVIREVNTPENSLLNLRKRWFTLIFLQGLLILVSYLVLEKLWLSQFAFRWFSLAVIFSVYFAGILWRYLDLNYRPEEKILLKRFGPGNLLTILRGFLLAYLFGFLFSPWPPDWLAWIPGVIYTIAAVADLFDGYLARKFDHETIMGQKLDINLDGLGLLIVSTLLVQYLQVPVWYLLVGFARYLFLVGIWLWRKRGKPIYDLAENSTRRPFAGAQMGFAAVVLFPLFSPPGTYLAAALFALPFLIGFLIDWMDVSGISRAAKFHGKNWLANSVNLNNYYLLWRKKENPILQRLLTLIVRISLVILLAAWIYQVISGVYIHQLFSMTLSTWVLWFGLALILNVISLFLIVIGAAGRIASLLILFGLGIYQNYFELSSLEVLLIAGAAAVFYLGSGPYSLWKPERNVIARRLGERQT